MSSLNQNCIWGEKDLKISRSEKENKSVRYMFAQIAPSPLPFYHPPSCPLPLSQGCLPGSEAALILPFCGSTVSELQVAPPTKSFQTSSWFVKGWQVQTPPVWEWEAPRRQVEGTFRWRVWCPSPWLSGTVAAKARGASLRGEMKGTVCDSCEPAATSPFAPQQDSKGLDVWSM